MKYLNLIFLIICCVIATTQSLTSQTLYGLKKSVNGSTTIPFDVVNIDPFTGNTTVEMSTNSLIGVAAGATAYDQQNKRYICWGFDTNNAQQLYVIDLDDSTSTSTAFSAIQPIEMEYDLKTQKTYGLWYTNGIEHFGEIDLITGVATSIATLPNVSAVAISNSTFNSNIGQYIFIGIENNEYRLITVTASTGAVVYSTPIYQNGIRFSALEYNVNNNKLYGLYQDIDSNSYSNLYFSYYTELKLSEIDLATGNLTVVNQTAVIDGYIPGYAIGGLCFDQLSENYIIYVTNENGAYLKMINVLTGNVVASTNLSNTDYFYELQCDNFPFARDFYNISNTQKVENKLISTTIYPNPTSDYLIIETTENIESISIFSLNGTLIKQAFSIDNQVINVKSLPIGNYILVGKTKSGIIRQQFIKQ